MALADCKESKTMYGQKYSQKHICMIGPELNPYWTVQSLLTIYCCYIVQQLKKSTKVTSALSNVAREHNPQHGGPVCSRKLLSMYNSVQYVVMTTK